MVDFGRIDASIPREPLRVPSEGAARRSLLSRGTDQDVAPGFRRFDLLSQQPAPRSTDPGTSEDRSRGRSLQDHDEQARRSPTGTPGAGQGDASQQDGVPQPLATGRTSLLSGSVGVMAQLFGQDLNGAGVAGSADGWTAWRDGTSQAGVSQTEAAQTEAGVLSGATGQVTALMIRLGIGTYEAVNRAIGAATEGLTRIDGVDYLFAMPSGGATALDEVA